MSDIEIPDEAALLVAKRQFDALGRDWATVPANTQAALIDAAREDLEAAYPSLRRQVLESVEEDVAEAIGRARWSGSGTWETAGDAARQDCLAEAGRVLGISKGDGDAQ